MCYCPESVPLVTICDVYVHKTIIISKDSIEVTKAPLILHRLLFLSHRTYEIVMVVN
jgi:hypothetical protein